MDFSIRSNRLELLDQPDIPADDIRRNMVELGVINDRLGGHAITWAGFRALANKNNPLHICEIGCGGGNNLKAIENRAAGRYPKLVFTGIDINSDCIRIAENTEWKSEANFIALDYKKCILPSKPDIIFSSLFCHHFKEDELIHMIQWMQQNSRSGFFINDLHRHPLAYHSIRLLTRLFSRSYLVKHDAPLSVLRGFKKNDLKTLMQKAAITRYTIRWQWAFRWLVIVHT